MGRAFVSVLIVALVGCASSPTRPPGPPKGEVFQLPWGAVAIDQPGQPVNEALRPLVVAGTRDRLEALRQQHPGGPIPYRLLALSGGGSRGAFGAGVLVGWTAAGTRPEFDVVTGISTGALMATFAFLGPEYDDSLRLYTQISDEDIYKKESLLTGLTGISLSDTRPLRTLIADQINEEILAAVAREYARGRRLFIGTTNLDARAFTVWDMGAIATSGRDDRLERFRNVILASASLPVLFPPVFIPVTDSADAYQQMHVDGGVRETIFLYDFSDVVREAASDLGLQRSDIDAHVYVLHNGTLFAEGTYLPVKPGTLNIAGASLLTLMRKNTIASLYRVSVQAVVQNMRLHYSYIPPDFELRSTIAEFKPEEMLRLFQFGEQQAIAGTAWETVEFPEDPAEILKRIDPSDALEAIEARPQYRR